MLFFSFDTGLTDALTLALSLGEGLILSVEYGSPTPAGFLLAHTATPTIAANTTTPIRTLLIILIVIRLFFVPPS
jgi:hypothetical protein